VTRAVSTPAVQRDAEYIRRAVECFPVMVEALREINQLVRKRTEPHMRAYTHFMRDFDQVRAICDKTIAKATT
jgi:hypothetical protein